jgi:MFS family permease
MVEKTSWPRVLLLVAGGVVVAFQVGKIPAALPALRAELGVDLVAAGWIVSIFAVIAALGGILVGGIADRFGHMKVAITGLIIAATANAMGALATSTELVLLGRVAEGFGFIVTTVALPPIVVAQCNQRDLGVALGIWGAYMPAGMGLMLFASPPILEAVGWRGLWLVCAVLIGLCAVSLMILLNNNGERSAPRNAKSAITARQVGTVLTSAGPLLLAVCFGAYAAQFISVTAFLPTLLIDQAGLSLTAAATAGAVVIIANVSGNLASGWILQRHVSRPGLIAIGFVLMAVCSLGVFTPWMSVELRFAAAILFSALGGLIPGTLMSSVPMHAPQAALVGTVMGLMLQGSGIGQVLGPPILAEIVTGFGGWGYAPLFTVCAALIGIAATAGLAVLARRARVSMAL